MHGKLPTNHIQNSHQISLDASCYRCQYILHLLQDCPKAMHVWQKLKLNFLNDTNGDELHQWFKTQATSKHNILFLIGCWFIWKARNGEAFYVISDPLWYILSQIYYLYNSTKVFGGPCPIPTRRMVSWHCPLDNVIKVNVDGSSIGNLGR